MYSSYQNQVTQTVLNKVYFFIFELFDKYSPIVDYTSNPIPVCAVFQVSVKSQVQTQFSISDPKYLCFLQEINFKNSQLSSRELFNLMELLCEFKEGHPQHKT